MIARGLALALLLCGCSSLGTRIAAPHTTTPWLTLRYTPGMIGQPWQLFVSEDGRASLVVENATYLQRLSDAEMRAVRDALSIAQLERMERAVSAPYSDLATLRINDVVVYGPDSFCDDADVRRFLRVWNAVVGAVDVPRFRDRKPTYEECVTQGSPAAHSEPGTSAGSSD